MHGDVRPANLLLTAAGVLKLTGTDANTYGGGTVISHGRLELGKTGVTAIPGGGYRTATSHLVERYRLLDNGAKLSVTFTWTDPAMYATPHSYEFRYLRVESGYEARPYPRCDPFETERAKFLDGAR